MTTIEDPTLEKQQRILAYFQNQQNLPLALIAGIGAALISALIWAAITVATEYQIGWMAVGVGFLVGLAVRLGKGIDKIYSIIGAVLALLGCLLGNFLSIIEFVAKHEHTDIFSILGILDFSQVPSVMMEMASPMDAVFYGIAIYQGYRLSIRSISPEEIEAAQQSVE